jgi:uncharacterized membrane protein YphA (DoxX/SURF4 family)
MMTSNTTHYIKLLLLSVGILILAFLLTDGAHGHARWFISEAEAAKIPTLQNIKEGIFQSGVFPAIVVIVIFLLITLFNLIEQLLFKYIKPIYYLAFIHKDKLTYFLKITIGLSLLYSSWHLTFLVPQMPVPEHLVLFAIALQTLIALSFISNLYTYFSSILLLMGYLFLVFLNYWVALEHMEIVGIALFILLRDSTSGKIRFVKHEAITILRVCTGISLVFLGLGEKILQPELAASFLAGHDVNFVKLFFFPDFSDQYFAMCAGLAEVLFGLMVIFGYSVRLLTLALFSLMLLTNIYMLSAKSVDSALLELAGHLPFFGIIAQILAFGDGKNITVRKTSYARYPVFQR